MVLALYEKIDNICNFDFQNGYFDNDYGQQLWLEHQIYVFCILIFELITSAKFNLLFTALIRNLIIPHFPIIEGICYYNENNP